MFENSNHGAPFMYSGTRSPSSFDSEESYKEKFENIKLLVQQQQRDLQTERLRNEGIKTITLCLDEERTENQMLRDENRKLESAVSVLQNRLRQNDLEASVSMQEGELLLPGPSKSLVDNLMSENSKLKQSLKYLNVDPVKTEQLMQQVSHLDKQTKKDHETITSLNALLAAAQERLNQSQDAKDNEIYHLQESVQSLRKNKDTQDVLCQSLSEETMSLRTQLQQTLHQMQNLMTRMDAHVTAASGQKQQQDATVCTSLSLLSVGPTPPNAELKTLREENETLRQQIDVQEIKLKEVIEMNARWQSYNKQREQYVQQLKQKLAESESNMAGEKLVSHQEEIDKTIMLYKAKTNCAEEEKMKVEDENRQLRQQLDQLKRAIVKKNEEIDTLRNRVPSGVGAEQKAVYESQIKIITEDFMQEREDRTKEHQKAQKLEDELAEVRAQLESLQRSHMDDVAYRRGNALRNYERQYQQSVYNPQRRNVGTAQSGYVARGIPVRYECDGETEDTPPGEDCVDGLQTAAAAATNRAHEDEDDDDDDTLQCPKCHLSFASEQHTELLEHLDICCA